MSVVLPIIQRGTMDCGLCCLQMLLDRPYDVIRDVALRLRPTLHTQGMTRYALQRTAGRLGCQLVDRRVIEAERAAFDGIEGILQVKLKRPHRGYHFVLLFHGVIYNPADGLLWELDTYLENKGRAVGLLTDEATQ